MNTTSRNLRHTLLRSNRWEFGIHSSAQHKLSCHKEEDKNLGILTSLSPLCPLLGHKHTEIFTYVLPQLVIVSPKVLCSTLWLASNTHSTKQTHKPRTKAWNAIKLHLGDSRGPANASQVTGAIFLDDRKFTHSCPKETPLTQVTIFWHPKSYSVYFINYHPSIQKCTTSCHALHIHDIHKEFWKMVPNLDMAPSHLWTIERSYDKAVQEGHEHTSTSWELLSSWYNVLIILGTLFDGTSPGSTDGKFRLHHTVEFFQSTFV
jgi:hypothetical protein